MARRVGAWAGAVLASAALLGVGVWAGHTVVEPPTAPASDPPLSLYLVEKGTVSQQLSYTARAFWAAGPTISSPAAGTVTSIDASPGAEVVDGARLYSVDARPVVAVDGAVPAFRDLAAGAQGQDVRQFQAFLVAQGFLAGEGADGVFGAATASATRAWQRAAGLVSDGALSLGEVVFLDLPARAYPAEGMRVGAVLSPGQPVLETVVGTPAFVLTPTTANAVSAASEGITATIRVGDVTISGVTGVAQQQPDGSTYVPVLSGADTPLCDPACVDAVPLPGPAVLSASLVVAPEREGPVVPVSAIRTGPDGASEVTMADGARRPIDVLVSYGGLAVVRGVEPGERVRLFGEA